MKSNRNHPAHQPVFESGNLSPIIFLTACSKDRKPILAKPDVHELLAKIWSEAREWAVGKYMIMPDHLHLFCSPCSRTSEPIRGWVRYWKSAASRSWPRPDEQPIWQQDVWDTQLRRGESYSEKWDYVSQNPIRAGLVNRLEDWPYQGEISVLSWHDR